MLQIFLWRYECYRISLVVHILRTCNFEDVIKDRVLLDGQSLSSVYFYLFFCHNKSDCCFICSVWANTWSCFFCFISIIVCTVMNEVKSFLHSILEENSLINQKILFIFDKKVIWIYVCVVANVSLVRYVLPRSEVIVINFQLKMRGTQYWIKAFYFLFECSKHKLLHF